MAKTHIDRNVYLLGAGASAEAGAPLIKNFLDAARELLDSPAAPLDEIERDHFRTVFDFRRKMAQAREKIHIDLDDIEQLFGLVEMSQRLGETTAETRKSTVYLIAKTLQVLIEQNATQRRTFYIGVREKYVPQLIKDYRAPKIPIYAPTRISFDAYQFFAGMVAGVYDDPDKRKFREDTIITFNYDLVCEHALRTHGIEADYALSKEIVNDRRDAPTSTTEVLKLHGSTNWGICDKCHKNVVILPQKVTDSPAEFRNLICTGCGSASEFVPLLVPPSWDKSDYAEVLAPVWKRAIKRLTEATRICIVGYSLPETDAFFKFLITMALAGNHQLYRLIVVDYQKPIMQSLGSLETAGCEPNPIHGRYLTLLDKLFQERRFKFFGNGFLSFLADYRSRELLGRCDMLSPANFE
jgi:NAD-dependent SIR2 family protein deacetylase